MLLTLFLYFVFPSYDPVFLVTSSGSKDDVFLLRNAPIPAGSSLELISGSKVIMESSDVLRVRTDTASAIDVAVSYLEQT